MTASPSLSRVARGEAAGRAGGAPMPQGPRVAALQSARYLRDPFAYYRWAEARYGRLFSLPTMNGLLLVTGTAEGAQELFTAPAEHFVVGFGVDAVRPIIGPGSLLLISGERHKRERRRLAPPFHGHRMRGAYSDVTRDTVQRRLASWEPGRTLSLHAEMQRMTLEVILRAVFGVQTPEEVEALATAVTRAVDAVHPLPIFFKAFQREFGGLGPWARFQRELACLDDLLYAWIRSRRRSGERGEDILSLILDAQDEEGRCLSDDEVRDQLLTLLVAGHETTSTTLAWLLYELHRQPALVARTREEIDSLGPDPGASELAGLAWLEALANETLRIHPVLLEVMRTVAKPIVFQGIDVPVGVTIAAAMPLVHGDPELYPEPERFRPERFLERRVPLAEFFAFGGGHRRCLGGAFAMNEIKVVVGTVLAAVELLVEGPLRPVRRNAIMAPEAGVPAHVLKKLH